MAYDCRRVIEKRKELWHTLGSLEEDKGLREATVAYMLGKNGQIMREEVKKHPEYLIEMFFFIVDKDQKTVPFFLNDVQTELLAIINRDIALYKQGKKNHLKYLLLKGRQQGFTSFVSAYQLARAITQKNFQGYTLADNADNTEAIFSDKAKYYLDTLPEGIVPTIKYSNRKELDFSKENGKGMNSKWRVATAGNIDAGRSKTLSFFHGSESAFWKDLRKILVGLAEAFTRNAIVILETTANGYNEYKQMWDDDNNYTKLFFEWHKTSEYRLPFEGVEAERSFNQLIRQSDSDDAATEEWIGQRLYTLREQGLDDEQLYWYYNKWKDKRESIKQEYPCSAEEAFLATGRNYFNTEQLAKRLTIVKPYKPRRGFFTYSHGVSQWTGEKTIVDDSVAFVDDPDGYIYIYDEEIPKTEPYTLGADTAGDGSDYNVGQMIDTHQRQVAVIRLAKDEDLFADQLYCLGKMYNWALIAPENNFSTYVTNTLKNREYPNLYVRENRPDAISKQMQRLYGFNTNKANRPAMLARLREIVRDRVECINDLTTLKEMFTFIIDERSKPVAIEGEHDDTIMAYAIAIYAQEQQIDEIKQDPDKLEGYYTDTELEDLGYSKWEIAQYHEGEPLYRR